jgi:2-amino-4-hydroxy-6-hydroxymethyldihydropteridine diphosphokinase
VDTQTVYLSLGSNMGDREENLRNAVEKLGEHVKVRTVSSLYTTDPVGVTDQPAFLNCALEGETELAPLELLAFVKGVERRIGRLPTFRWGPRVVDVDILMVGDLVIDLPELTIPHRELRHRRFVLLPLAEIAADLQVPGTGLPVSALLEATDTTAGVARMKAFSPTATKP